MKNSNIHYHYRLTSNVTTLLIKLKITSAEKQKSRISSPSLQKYTRLYNFLNNAVKCRFVVSSKIILRTNSSVISTLQKIGFWRINKFSSPFNINFKLNYQVEYFNGVHKQNDYLSRLNHIRHVNNSCVSTGVFKSPKFLKLSYKYA